MISSFLKVTQPSENCQPKSRGNEGGKGGGREGGEQTGQGGKARGGLEKKKVHEERGDRDGDNGENTEGSGEMEV